MSVCDFLIGRQLKNSMSNCPQTETPVSVTTDKCHRYLKQHSGREINGVSHSKYFYSWICGVFKLKLRDCRCWLEILSLWVVRNPKGKERQLDMVLVTQLTARIQNQKQRLAGIGHKKKSCKTKKTPKNTGVQCEVANATCGNVKIYPVDKMNGKSQHPWSMSNLMCWKSSVKWSKSSQRKAQQVRLFPLTSIPHQADRGGSTL